MRQPVGQAERIDVVRGSRASYRRARRRPGTCRAPAARRPCRPTRRSARARRCAGAMSVRASSSTRSSADDRIAARAEILGDEVGLAVGQHRHRRRRLPQKWPPWWSSVSAAWTVPSPPLRTMTLRPDPGDGAHRLGDLADLLHLIVEDVLLVRAKAPHPRQLADVAGRPRVGEERDEGHRLGGGPDAKAVTVEQGDVHARHAAADVERHPVVGRAQADQAHARVAREAAAVAPARAAIAVGIVPDRDRVAARRPAPRRRRAPARCRRPAR